MTAERPLAKMSGYAMLNLINEADDFKKNRLAKLGKANKRTQKTIVKETNVSISKVDIKRFLKRKSSTRIHSERTGFE
jgi:hypothetical protein